MSQKCLEVAIFFNQFSNFRPLHSHQFNTNQNCPPSFLILATRLIICFVNAYTTDKARCVSSPTSHLFFIIYFSAVNLIKTETFVLGLLLRKFTRFDLLTLVFDFILNFRFLDPFSVGCMSDTKPARGLYHPTPVVLTYL